MMKSLLRTRIVILLLFLATAFAVGQQVEKEPQRSVRVQGIGKVRVVPDQLRLTIQVNVPRAETAVEALSRTSQLTTQVIALLKRFGIIESDIQTTRIAVHPIYDYDKRIAPPPIVGYTAQNDVQVVVKTMADAGKILDQAVKNGATGFGPLQYESSKRTELEREALKNAADDAKAKAELLAKQLGGTIGRVISIVESSVSSPPSILSMEARVASAEVPVMAGEIEMTARVEVVFEMR
jgi:uncharacterized protein YggE